MKFTETNLKGAYIIELEPFQDHRGMFARTFCKKEFDAIAHHKEFVQFNHSRTANKGTLRGMHYQKPPFAEIKLIRCIRGAVYDVIIDVRKNSPTFLKYIGVELTEENQKMIYVPEGFAHGFQTMTDDAELLYKHTAYYTPGSEGGLRYDEPNVNIAWPLDPIDLSKRDIEAEYLTEAFDGIEISSQPQPINNLS
ncbi:MAG: dTDP-4-dehydrorhamnose 3,5-epimerase [Bacteroidota bacterium]